MQVKVLEIRDSMTYFALLCVNMQPDNDAQQYHMRRVGYPCDNVPNVVVTRLSADNAKATNDYFAWSDRTMAHAHKHITEKWDTLRDGDVVDVEFILGETIQSKESERFEKVRP